MFDKTKLKSVIENYKKDFYPYLWEKGYDEEQFKWIAVKTFQKHWDINAENFPSMLEDALSDTKGLLDIGMKYPRSMITGFAGDDAERVRAMFLDLFDESRDIVERISAFKHNSEELLKLYGNGAKNHYQDENTITTYLWLRYPEKYYIYRYGESRELSKAIDSSYRFKKGDFSGNIRNYLKMYDEVCDEVQKDQELINLVKKHLTKDCYLDEKCRTLTFDISFYIKHYYSSGQTAKQRYDEMAEWLPKDYSPELSTETWLTLLQDSTVFTASSVQIMKRLKDYGGQATCSQLATKYGESKNFYISGSAALAKRVADKTGCPVITTEDDNTKWWPILYLGKKAAKDEDGVFIWKLRKELADALDEFDLSDTELYASALVASNCKYWWLNANPKIWSFADLKVGEAQSYTLYNDNGNKRRIFQNFLSAKAGDMVIGYESNPVKQIVALAKIVAEQDGEKVQFEKVESLSSPIDYAVLKEIPELEKMEFFTNPNGSLFRLTKGEYDFLMDLIRDENPIEVETDMTKYDKTDFLSQVFMSEKRYDMLVSVLKNKKNIILQGAPGVGKTYAAKRLAYSMMGEQDDSRIEFVQFHQNYSYEDFMMGYKPAKDGFELKTGIFYRFCQKAANQPEKDFFFIIDEINRGNMSKIFGELLMLIENEYRGTKATLAYNGISFSVPTNLYIIGMMNTADRSLAMIDYALRRRFSFFEMEPGFDSEGFLEYQDALNNDTFTRLIEKIKELNKEITNDKSLGKGFCIGHSYFSNWKDCTDEKMKSVIDFDVIPMLDEYWFDDSAKLQRWSNILHGVFQ